MKTDSNIILKLKAVKPRIRAIFNILLVNTEGKWPYIITSYILLTNYREFLYHYYEIAW